MSKQTYISKGDFIDLYYKIKLNGSKAVLSLFNLTNQSRIFSKWNEIIPSSEFWLIPDIRKRWNEKCTGIKDLEYEDYFVSKYLTDSTNLRLLSVGCGDGARERKFAKYSTFSLIEGIDIASKLVNEARDLALLQNFNNLKYYVDDFLAHDFRSESYDIVLFNSSLHHFNNIDNLLKSKVFPLLKKDGFLIVFEYAGPKRLQWTNLQLQNANRILKEIPVKYKYRVNSKSIKHKIYRPGLLRMFLVDPSEAIDSESILPSLHKYFNIVEEKKVGTDILHILLKDISHNFLSKDAETQNLLSHLFEQEDEYLRETGKSDYVFGIYTRS